MTNAQFALCITTNRHLAVWNCPAPPAPACEWTELLDTDVLPDGYVRVTVEMAYARDTNGYFSYRVWANGAPSSNPKAWYAAANPTRNSFNRITAEGAFRMDDLTVRAVSPFSPVSIIASSAGYGTISPAGTNVVPYGSTASFTNTPSPRYHVGSVAVDGSGVGAPLVYTFTNVTASHTIAASFAADTVSSNTPTWWLEEANPAWAGDFEAAATADQDGDGAYTWQEYISGTSPTNSASVFDVTIARSNGMDVVRIPTIVPGARYEGLTRYYSLECATNLVTGSWASIPGCTDIPASGQIIVYTNPASATNVFYQGKVRLAP